MHSLTCWTSSESVIRRPPQQASRSPEGEQHDRPLDPWTTCQLSIEFNRLDQPIALNDGYVTDNVICDTRVLDDVRSFPSLLSAATTCLGLSPLVREPIYRVAHTVWRHAIHLLSDKGLLRILGYSTTVRNRSIYIPVVLESHSSRATACLSGCPYEGIKVQRVPW